MTDLTAPIRIGAMTAVNRIAMAPMTNKQSNDDGTLTDAEIQWLAQRARGGFGLIITGAYAVAPGGRVWDGQAAVYADRHTAPLSRLGAAINATSSLGIVQLIHGGSRYTPALAGTEGISASQGPSYRQATASDIDLVTDVHRQAALRVQSAGIHGVEIHSAHGFLPAQFLSHTDNHRTDAWGGGLPNRARFLCDLVRTIRHAAGPDFIIGVRLSPENPRHGIELAETTQVAAWLADDGVDYLHLSLPDALAPSEADPHRHPVQFIKPALPASVPLVAAGKIWTPAEAHALVRTGADIVALGQAALYNPDWPQHVTTPLWSPTRPPLRPDQFSDLGVTAPFLDYLREDWPGSVS